MEEKKDKMTREEVLLRWERAKRRKREHVAKLEEELNKKLAKDGLESVKLEVW